MALVSSILHRLGVLILRYLDNWWFLVQLLPQALCAKDLVLDLCHELGILVNLEKLHLQPYQSVICLKMQLDFWTVRAFPTLRRVQKIQCQLEGFLSHQSQLANKWRHILGCLSFLTQIVSGGRTRMRALQLVFIRTKGPAFGWMIPAWSGGWVRYIFARVSL